MARKCVSCASAKVMVPFSSETFTIKYGAATTKISGLSGWKCVACGEVEFDARSAKRYAAAGDALVIAQRKELGTELRRIRRKLGLTQASAARLTGGGHNAFSRYERGEVIPMSSVVNLFRLLDKHPELLKDLKAVKTRRPAGSARSTERAKLKTA
ncbi:transcriptional regulator, XRE family [Candidatus Koribacter versatilis Ellin345]|uniref:Transcriptional regulator, XRE family n=1 Tax=Koribacter versatilis (strain Ellin345) TaxID=204669 RepID=Q1IJ02_KORVE|nr:type II toxin-antitoxin system MqsA family antitoxin [Candidatus Koribacter versatilis]ABF43148.1 transcriptional regulator, XRE family [Candidatus Koribacter versatilis Ellin345]